MASWRNCLLRSSRRASHDGSFAELIEKKKQGGELTDEELAFWIDGVVRGSIPEYQTSAMLMAVYFRGMSPRETSRLTYCIAHSGDVIDLSSLKGIKADKHSSGGVADTVSIPLIAVAASCGALMPKMSGRGLGHTGGTIDKLEAIPGFNVNLSPSAFMDIVSRLGGAIIAQTSDIAVADKKLYALRDVTATIDSVPLIASSIMGKKLASGADVIVLDVKWGTGAFMETREAATALARTMVDIGEDNGKRTIAYVTDMNEPLGNAVGNALEVLEAVQVLKGTALASSWTSSSPCVAKSCCRAASAPASRMGNSGHAKPSPPAGRSIGSPPSWKHKAAIQHSSTTRNCFPMPRSRWR